MAGDWIAFAPWEGSPTQDRVPENGLGLLVAWLVAETVPPELVATASTAGEPRADVREECLDTHTGVTTVTYKPLSDEDLRTIADMNDGYLIDAGVPPLGVGVAVYITLPPGVANAGEFCDLVYGDVWEEDIAHPSGLAAALREAIPRRYQGAGSPHHKTTERAVD